MVVAHSDVWAGALAVGVKMGEACFDSQAFHGRQKMSSGVSNGLVPPSEAPLAHSFLVDYSMEGLKVFVDGRHTQEPQAVDAMSLDIEVDSKWAETACVRREMWYSVRKMDAAVVLDP